MTNSKIWISEWWKYSELIFIQDITLQTLQTLLYEIFQSIKFNATDT